MYKEEVIKQGERALDEMLRAKEAYAKSKHSSFTADLFEDTVYLADSDDIDCCCLGMVFISVIAVPFLIMSKVEKKYLIRRLSQF